MSGWYERWRRILGPLLGVIVIVLALLVHPLDTVPELRVCADPVTVNVVSSTEKAGPLATLADRYNAAAHDPEIRCGEIRVHKVSSGIAEELLADPDHQDAAISEADRAAVRSAHVWAPSSVVWLEQLDLDSRSGYGQRPVRSLAASPLVLAMTEATAGPLGWLDRPPTWRQAMDALGDDLFYTQENPRTSTSGAMATFLTYAAAAAGDGELAPATLTAEGLPSLSGFVRTVQSAAKGGFLNDSVEILRGWNQSANIPANTMIMVQEQMVYGFNDGLFPRYLDSRQTGRKPEVPLVAIHPVGPSGMAESIVADHPWVPLDTAGDDEKAIAEHFLSYVMKNWNVLCDAGFRSPVGNGSVGCAPARPGETAVVSLPLPDGTVRSEMVRRWLDLRSKRRITIAMDVSGSMRDERLREATRAVADGVGLMRPTDQVEIFQFAGTESHRSPYWSIRDLADVGTGWAAEAARLGSAPRDETLTKRSSVHTTVRDLYDRVAARHASGGGGTLDVLIVLSDGVNDWNDGISDAAVCAHLKKNRVDVPVHTIHYDPGIYSAEQQRDGAAALEQYANCSGVSGQAAESSSNSQALRNIMSQVLGSA
ncbi:vWA domain-containing protein [Actinoplanes couchii]|uniref:VWFA domain-containing protein n=1 Tax=Actinoplanes couchii TaxID=403638 RepID=A0ABQ3XCW1_9ACTN|nr:vWA domain-containing protein [Actinoplanes couchii]MDR6321190.1 Ca-activated chloride channel family protein [Actinoplanes couchii]GID56298.1 hypothetical protein Aco03nite_047020 [Actinoplanes couchii]